MSLRGFHSPAEWANTAVPDEPDLLIETARSGEPAARRGEVWLHSRYNPAEEAVRLVDSASLKRRRPVLVVGAGLGYHIRELAARGYEVAAVDPSAAVVRAAAQTALSGASVPLAAGDAADIAGTPDFKRFAERCPQVLVHPATARLHQAFVAEMETLLVEKALDDARLSVAVVGPMYGGSLPVARSLADGFDSLGHQAEFIDNSAAWPLYESILGGIRSKKTAGQVGDLVANALNEWTYARIMQSAPDIVIVLAQAPVNATLAPRLRKEDIVTAFWFVENWRHLSYWQAICRDYDMFFHIQPGEFEAKLDAAGCPHHAFVQTGCDPKLHRPVELSDEEKAEFGCDLAFAGAGYFNRIQTFLGLTDYDFKIWGVDWDALELQRLIQRPNQRFDGAMFSRICAGAKINLNLHSSTAHPGVDPDCDAINPRVFDIAACGGFQLCDAAKGVESYFDPETELPLYRNMTELRAKIDHYLARPDERIAVAERARKRALAEHTYAHRAQRMLDLLLPIHGPALVRKGVRVQRTIGDVREDAATPESLRALLRTLPGDERFTHSAMNRLLAMPRAPKGYAEELFALMYDVRITAESLISDRF